MNPLPTLNVQDPSLLGLGTGPGSVPASKSGQDAVGRDLAWQRALEQAQQASLAAWFLAPPPQPGTATEVQASIPPSGERTQLPLASPFPNLAAAKEPGIREPLPSAANHPQHHLTPCDEGPTDPLPLGMDVTPANLADTLPGGPSETTPNPLTSGVARPTLSGGATQPSNLPQTSALAQFVADLCSTPVVHELSPALSSAAMVPATGHGLEPAILPPSSPVAEGPMPPPLGEPFQLAAQTSPLGPQALEQAVVEDIDEPLPVAPAAAPATAPASEPTPHLPLRLHAEWSEQGVRIWLGSDANQALPLDQLTLHLRQWLTHQGARLLTLVCNGRTLWDESSDRAITTSEGEFKAPANPASPYPIYQSFTSALATGRVHAY